MQAYISKVILLVHLLQSILGVEKQGLHLLDTSNRCLCPGDSLTYECTVMGESGGSTVWMGSVFNCTSQEISLFHGDYESTKGAYNDCGGVVGQSVRSYVSINTTNDNSTTVALYTSRLTVPINSGIVGKTIECLYDDGAIATLVGRETVNIIIAYSAPLETLYMSNADFISRKLTFSWSTDCGAMLHYNILASNCGSCPTTTNHTTVTCTDVPINGNSCTFALETVVCGHSVGNKSETIQAVLEGCSKCVSAIVSASLLAVILSICMAVFTSITVYLLRHKTLNIKEKMNIRSGQSSSRTATTITTDYEDVRHDCTGRPNSTIDTKKNVAYGQGHTVSTTVSQ